MTRHRLHTIYTAHYRYPGADRVDITVKGQDTNWKEFAPTWDMVMGIKNKTMTEGEYIRRYLAILDRVSCATWDRLLCMPEVTFVCFCTEHLFCHRNILVNYMVKSLGDRVVSGGWRVM